MPCRCWIVCISFHGSKFQNSLPLLFVVLIGVIASEFGSSAGILGTVGSAIVFAEFLFQPMFSLRVNDSIERNNLVWMVIIGIIISEFLGVRPSSPSHGGEHKGIPSI